MQKTITEMMDHQHNVPSPSLEPILKKGSRIYAQVLQNFTLEIQKDIPFNLDLIDDWLHTVLKVDIEPSSSSVQTHKNPICTEVVWRVLLLARTLLQSIRIPAFDTGEIYSIEKVAQHFHVKIAIVHIDHIPRKVCERVLRLSLRSILELNKRTKTAENRELLFTRIQQNFITPFYNISRSGKSTMPILESAHRQHIPFRHMQNGVYILGWGSKAIQIDRSSTQHDSPIGSRMSHSKIITASLLHEIGLPSPIHEVVHSLEEASKAARRLQWPLVVKPSDADRGEGVSIDVTNMASLKNAFEVAHKVSKSKKILVEKQVKGVCCRIFIANGKMLYAVKRLPKSVIGNGKDTVKVLIEEANLKEKNLPPWKRSEPFPFDDDAFEAMQLSGFTLQSIPQNGTLIPLRKIESTQWGGFDEEITEVIHPDNLKIALRAARIFGLHVAGIDIITADISVPWYENDAIINEVNYSPQYGGGEISRKSIPHFLDDLIEGDGRIPITVIVGGDDAMLKAKQLQKTLCEERTKAFVTSHKESISDLGEEIHFSFQSLYKRSRALLLDTEVEALIMVIQTDELLQTGLPVDYIHTLLTTKDSLHGYANPEDILSEQIYRRLMTLLSTLQEDHTGTIKIDI